MKECTMETSRSIFENSTLIIHLTNEITKLVKNRVRSFRLSWVTYISKQEQETQESFWVIQRGSRITRESICWWGAGIGFGWTHSNWSLGGNKVLVSFLFLSSSTAFTRVLKAPRARTQLAARHDETTSRSRRCKIAPRRWKWANIPSASFSAAIPPARCRNAWQTMPITYNLRGPLTSSDKEENGEKEEEREGKTRELKRSVSVQRYFPAIRNASPSRPILFRFTDENRDRTPGDQANAISTRKRRTRCSIAMFFLNRSFIRGKFVSIPQTKSELSTSFAFKFLLLLEKVSW